MASPVRRGLVAALVDNPIIYYEAMPKLMRRLSPVGQAAVVGGVTVLGLLGGLYVRARHPVVAPILGGVCFGAWSVLTVIMAAMQVAVAISRERQQRTWDALVMTRLGPAGVILGKLGGTLLPLWALGIMLLPGSVCLVTPHAPTTDIGPWWVLLVYAGTVVVSASFAGLGIYCSMVCGSGGTSQLLVLGLLFALQNAVGFVVVPLGWVLSLLEGPNHVMGVADTWALGIVGAVSMLAPGFVLGDRTIRRFRRLDRYGRR